MCGFCQLKEEMLAMRYKPATNGQKRPYANSSAKATETASFALTSHAGPLKRHGAMEKPLVKFGRLIPRKFAMAAMANPLTAPLTSHIMAPVAASCCPCWVEAPPDWPRRSRKRPGEVWLFKTSVDLWSTVMSLMSSIVGLVHPTFSSNINPFGNAESQRVP